MLDDVMMVVEAFDTDVECLEVEMDAALFDFERHAHQNVIIIPIAIKMKTEEKPAINGHAAGLSDAEFLSRSAVLIVTDGMEILGT
jgi:hypothetical protein